MASDNNIPTQPFGVIPHLEKTGKQPDTNNIIFARTTTDSEMKLAIVTSNVMPSYFWASIDDIERVFTMKDESIYWAWPAKIKNRQATEKLPTENREISSRENFACVTLTFLEDWRDGRLNPDEVCETLFAAAIARGLIDPKKTPS